MRLDEKDTDRLLKILDYCDEVEATIAYFGDDYETFSMNTFYQNASEMVIFQIGETANHLSDEVMGALSDVPWRSIVGLRNVIAHGYDILKAEQIWHVMKEDIVSLKLRIETFLAANGVDTSL